MADYHLRRCIILSQKIQDKSVESLGHQELGHLLATCGLWDEAEQELDTTFRITEQQNHIQMQGLTWSICALRFLRMAREGHQSKTINLKSSIQSASRALKLANEFSYSNHRVERDYLLAYWLLGAAYRGYGDLTKGRRKLIPSNQPMPTN